MTRFAMSRLTMSVFAMVALVSFGWSGCGGSLVADRAVHVTAPAALSSVTTPFTATWTSSEKSTHRYAVFVDRLPIPPGHTLRDVALDQCKRQPSCYPDATYLAGLGIYLTADKSVTIPTLKVQGGLAGTEHPAFHNLTVVLFSGDGTTGHRVGEAAWEVEFRGQ